MTPRQPKRKKGAQPGNRNARKHGFYSKVLTPEQQDVLNLATRVTGLDREVAILRLKIASILKNDPQNVELLARAAGSLAYLLRTRQRLMSSDRRDINDLYRRFVSWLKQDLSQSAPGRTGGFIPGQGQDGGFVSKGPGENQSIPK
jgi:hypothetical protein